MVVVTRYLVDLVWLWICELWLHFHEYSHGYVCCGYTIGTIIYLIYHEHESFDLILLQVVPAMITKSDLPLYNLQNKLVFHYSSVSVLSKAKEEANVWFELSAPGFEGIQTSSTTLQSSLSLDETSAGLPEMQYRSVLG